MKGYGLVFVLLIMQGCSSAPTTTVESDWLSYGASIARAGFHPHSSETLFDGENIDSGALYRAYQEGYGKAKDKYCDQNPLALGLSGQSYHGICDDRYPNFRAEFEKGRLLGANQRFL